VHYIDFAPDFQYNSLAIECVDPNPKCAEKRGKMSRFSDKLQSVYRGSTPSIGFRRSAGAENPPLLIIARLSKPTVKEARAMAGADIDAGIISSEGVDVVSLGKLATTMGDIPLGLFLEGANQEEIVEFADSGCDFVVFGLKTPLKAVKKEGIGKILQIEPSLDHGLARAINELDLPVDGVLVTGEEPSLTVERLLVYQRFGELLDRPLLVTLGSSVTSGELSSLYEAGVNGVVLPEGLPTEALTELRKTIDSLPKRVKRKAKGAAVLPQVAGELETEEEEEEI